MGEWFESHVAKKYGFKRGGCVWIGKVQKDEN